MEKYKVVKVIRETADVVTLHLVDGAKGHPNFIAGQCVSVLIPGFDMPGGKAYSISSIPSDPHFSLTIKEVGAYSKALCGLAVGDELSISQPYGFLNPQFHDPIVAIAGGIGISPLISIIRDTLEHDSTRPIQLWYSVATATDVVFRDQLDELSSRYEQFHVEYFVTRDKNPGDGYNVGRIDVAKTLARLNPDPASLYIICGHDNFSGDIWRALAAAEVMDNKIATETFF